MRIPATLTPCCQKALTYTALNTDKTLSHHNLNLRLSLNTPGWELRINVFAKPCWPIWITCIFLRRGDSGRSRKASCPKPSPRFSLCPEQWNLREAFWEECPCGHCSLVCRTSGFTHVKNVAVLRRCTIKLFSSSGVSQALWRKKHQAAGLFISCMNKKERK